LYYDKNSVQYLNGLAYKKVDTFTPKKFCVLGSRKRETKVEHGLYYKTFYVR